MNVTRTRMAQAIGNEHFGRLARATEQLETPFAVIDLDAFRANAGALTRRAYGKPLRVASKSLRCRALLRHALDTPGYRGVLAFTLPEALWLAERHEDVVVGYPSTDGAALRRLAADEELARRVTLMVDSPDQLDFLQETACPSVGRPLRVCLELDASLRLLGGRVHIGARRSPVHTPTQALALAREITDRPGFRLVGMMAYESQIAGVGGTTSSRVR
jgi:D-serine deaminase-like pyridoxal phosphate-dependent protein